MSDVDSSRKGKRPRVGHAVPAEGSTATQQAPGERMNVSTGAKMFPLRLFRKVLALVRV